MTFLATLDITGLTHSEYRAVLDEMGVEERPAAGIYLHLAAPTDSGFRIIELWDDRDAFYTFLEQRLAPASKALGIERATEVTIVPLHNLFAPRISDVPSLVSALPGARRQATTR